MACGSVSAACSQPDGVPASGVDGRTSTQRLLGPTGLEPSRTKFDPSWLSYDLRHNGRIAAGRPVGLCGDSATSIMLASIYLDRILAR